MIPYLRVVRSIIWGIVSPWWAEGAVGPVGAVGALTAEETEALVAAAACSTGALDTWIDLVEVAWGPLLHGHSIARVKHPYVHAR